MKVSENLGKAPGIVGSVSKEERRASDSKGMSFQSRIKHVEGQNYQEKIKQLAARITEQGEILGKKIDIRELKVYKKLISEFLDEAVNNSHRFSKESFLDRRGRFRVYATVKKVNTELDALTEDVLKDEKDNIKILQRLDDIRGLIMDLTI